MLDYHIFFEDFFNIGTFALISLVNNKLLIVNIAVVNKTREY